MTARAIVTRYGNEQANYSGDFQLDAYFLISDPARQGTGAGLDGRVLVANAISLPAGGTTTSWATAIENAVIAEAVSKGFLDLNSANTFLPAMG